MSFRSRMSLGHQSHVVSFYHQSLPSITRAVQVNHVKHRTRNNICGFNYTIATPRRRSSFLRPCVPRTKSTLPSSGVLFRALNIIPQRRKGALLTRPSPIVLQVIFHFDCFSSNRITSRNTGEVEVSLGWIFFMALYRRESDDGGWGPSGLSCAGIRVSERTSWLGCIGRLSTILYSDKKSSRSFV